MPWCESCDHFYNPNTVQSDGTCPECGEQIADPEDSAKAAKVPWHFWLMVSAAGVYLGWRAIEGFGALFG
jgi:hypothetical protein